MRIASVVALVFFGGTAVAGASSDGWQRYEDPLAAGWNVQKLEEAKGIAEQLGAVAVMVVEDGVVVAAWGDIDRPFPIYSMRKGIYSALAGMLVRDGMLELDATLKDLGIDDLDGLSEQERMATVEQLLTSRSGIYHVSAYEPASMKRNRPERGAHAPGEYWFYNNWDFNLVAHLIEEGSGHDLATFFRAQLAVPLGMEDVSDETVFSFFEPSRSRFAAPIFRMSARDLARFGVLFEQKGTWKDHRLLDEKWIDASWQRHTEFVQSEEWEDADGFGYMWWIHSGSEDAERPFARHDVYLTRGSDGQVLAVIPSHGLVVVHLTDTETGEGGSFEGAARLIDQVIAAKLDGGKNSTPVALVNVEPEASSSPEHKRRSVVEWSADEIAALVGEYALNPQISFLVHAVDGRLFALPRGVLLAEVELFRDEEGVLFSPAVDLALTVERDEKGMVTAFRGQMEGRPVRMTRAD